MPTLLLPIKFLLTLLNVIFAGGSYIVAFTLKMALTVVSVLAPFASAALLFVSNETDPAATLTLDTRPKKTFTRISTPDDGAWFTQFFEANPEIEKIEYRKGKLVMKLPKEDAAKDHFVTVNLYSLKQ